MVSTDPRSELNLAREKRKLFTAFLALLGLLIAAFLVVSGTFYSARRAEFTEGTEKSVSNVVSANSSNLAMELFVNRTSAYALRLKDLQEKLATVVTNPQLCLADAHGKLVAGTISDCEQSFDRHSFGIALPIVESDAKIGELFVAYRDPFRLSSIIADYRWHIAAILCSFAIALMALVGFFKNYMGKVFNRVSVFERQATMGQTAQMLAHDIQTPLNVLQHGLSIISETNDAAKIKRLALNTLPAVEKAKKQIQNMLADLREIGSAKELELKNLSVEQIIYETLSDIRVLFDYLDIDLKYQFNHKGGIRGDEHKLSRVMSNILVNAVQAMQGEGTISFSTKSVQEGGRSFVEMAIANSGSFIPQEDCKAIFSSFYSKGKKKGTGLGLAIVRKIIDEHGGNVRCESDQEKGTTITFTVPGCREGKPARMSLPCRLSTDQHLPEVTGVAASEVAHIKPVLNILIADDDPFFIQAIHDLLTSESLNLGKRYRMKIETAENADDAFSISNKLKPDVIFLDVDFGSSLDGHDVLKRLRASGSKSLIIMNTNSSSIQDKRASESLGADAHIQKPVARGNIMEIFQRSGIIA